MAKGFEGVREISERQQQQRQAASAGSSTYKRKLILPNTGDSAQVRFLEQGDEIHWCYIHDYLDGGRRKQTPCLDQDGTGGDCPMCEHMDPDKDYLKRKFQGYINVIWRDAPQQEKKDNDWVTVGRQDTQVYWAQGIKTFTKLDEIDAAYKGLMSREFIVRRKGTGFDTEYSIVPADPDSGPQELSEADKKFYAEKYDLNELIIPLSYEDASALVGIRGPKIEQTQQRPNPFDPARRS